VKKFNLLTRDGRDGRDAVLHTLKHCRMSLFYSFSSWKEREKASYIRVAKSASRASQRHGIKDSRHLQKSKHGFLFCRHKTI